MIVCLSCLCSSSDSLIRNLLKSAGYPDWISIHIEQGKERSLRALRQLPRFSEIEMLEQYIKGASKWAVIVGYNENACRWSDIAHNGQKSRIEAELLVQNFS